MTLRNYSSTAAETTLSAGVDASVTTLTVSATTGFPAVPFVLAIDAGAAAQELVLVTNVAGTTLTVTRAFDSTVASAHSTGAVVAHSHAAIDFREANTHVNASAAHGTTGNVVGTTDAQTLTNKTLSLGSNTLTATKAQLKAAVTDEDPLFATDFGAWSTDTPTLTAEGGALGAATASTRYFQIGKMVWFRTTISITSVGTATGSVVFTLPVTASTVGSSAVGSGRHGATGATLQVYRESATQARVFKYDNTGVVSVADLFVNGFYEAA